MGRSDSAPNYIPGSPARGLKPGMFPRESPRRGTQPADAGRGACTSAAAPRRALGPPSVPGPRSPVPPAELSCRARGPVRAPGGGDGEAPPAAGDSEDRGRRPAGPGQPPAGDPASPWPLFRARPTSPRGSFSSFLFLVGPRLGRSERILTTTEPRGRGHRGSRLSPRLQGRVAGFSARPDPAS